MSQIYLGLVDTNVVPAGYDKYLWINKGCVRAIKECKKNQLDYSVVNSPWEKNGSVEKGMSYLERVKYTLLQTIAKELNSYSGDDYSINQWELLIGSWMNSYLATLYDKYLRLRQLKGIEKSVFYNSCTSNTIFRFIDYQSFIEEIRENDEIHLYLYRQLMNKMDLNFRCSQTDCTNIEFQEIDNHSNNSRINLKNALLKKYYELNSCIHRKKVKVVIKNTYLPAKVEFDINRKTQGQCYVDVGFWNKGELCRDIKLDEKWRKQYISAKFDDEFMVAAYELYRRFIPMAYVEAYSLIRETSKKEYGSLLHAKHILYSCLQVEADELFKHYLLRVKGQGAKTYCIQHGGNYGFEKNMIMYHEYLNCDCFITWGWSGKKDYKCEFFPMPATKLIALDKVIKNNDMGNKREKILYAGYIFPRNVVRLTYQEACYENDIKDEYLFFKRLNERVIENMVVRLNANDYGWGTANGLRRINENIIIDDSGSYYDALQGARILISSEWSTTSIEALCAGVPVLIREKRRTIEGFAVEDYESLREVGIIVETFADLAESTNRIYNCIEQWWGEEKRQEVVKRIKEKYAYLPERAEKIWIETIKKMCDEE